MSRRDRMSSITGRISNIKGDCGVSLLVMSSLTELYRTLYRLLTRDLEPGKVGLASLPWLSGVRVVSLVLGEWIVDNRRRNQRLQEPRLVDVGWTDALFPSFFERLTGSETVHLELSSSMKNPGSKVT